MTKNEFKKLTSTTTFLDGATGSNLMAAGMPKGVCTEEWILDNPAIFIELQKKYVEAGSQIVYAPTFGGNRINLKKHGLDNRLEELNRSLVALSQKAVDGMALVAGDLSPTGDMGVAYEDAFEAYKEQAQLLLDAGVDLFVVETMFQIDEACAAIDAINSICDLPVMCTMTVEADGSIFAGGNIFEAAPMLEAAGADAVGINCSVGPDQLVSVVKNLSTTVSIPVIAKPNAGMPTINDKGLAVYDMSADAFAAHMKVLIDNGARIVGGCCGTTPEFMKEMISLLK